MSTSRRKHSAPPTTTTTTTTTLTPSARVHDEVEGLFQALRQEIAQCHERVHAVQAFRQHIEAGVRDGIFDQEDLEWLNRDLTQLLEEKEQRERELAHKEHMYKNSVQKLEVILEKRRDVIEQAERDTQALTLRPHLLQQFAKKRAHLMMLVDQGKKDLQS